jgi:hypothetical protein
MFVQMSLASAAPKRLRGTCHHRESSPRRSRFDKGIVMAGDAVRGDSTSRAVERKHHQQQVCSSTRRRDAAASQEDIDLLSLMRGKPFMGRELRSLLAEQ